MWRRDGTCLDKTRQDGLDQTQTKRTVNFGWPFSFASKDELNYTAAPMTPSIALLLKVFALWLTMTMVCCSGGSPRQTAPVGSLNATAAQLIQDYKANEVRADGVWKGHTVFVTGKVESVAKDIMDNPYVTLSDGSEFGLMSVQCTFDHDDYRLPGLTKGDTVIVSGVCEGKMFNVLLSGCAIH